MQSHSCLARALLYGLHKVAARFGGPLSDHDAEIASLRVGAIPNNTKATHCNGSAASKSWLAIIHAFTV